MTEVRLESPSIRRAADGRLVLPLRALASSGEESGTTRIDVYARVGAEVLCPEGQETGSGASAWADSCAMFVSGATQDVEVREPGGFGLEAPAAELILASPTMRPRVLRLGIDDVVASGPGPHDTAASDQWFRGVVRASGESAAGWPVRAHLLRGRLTLREESGALFGERSLNFPMSEAAGASVRWLDGARDLIPLPGGGRLYSGYMDAAWATRNFSQEGATGDIYGKIDVIFSRGRRIEWEVDLSADAFPVKNASWGEISYGGGYEPTSLHDTLVSRGHEAGVTLVREDTPRRDCALRQTWMIFFSRMSGGKSAFGDEDILVGNLEERTPGPLAGTSCSELFCLDLPDLPESTVRRLSRIAPDSPVIPPVASYWPPMWPPINRRWLIDKLEAQGFFAVSCSRVESEMARLVSPSYQCQPTSRFEIVAFPRATGCQGVGEALASGAVKRCPTKWLLGEDDISTYLPGASGDWERAFGPLGNAFPVNVFRSATPGGDLSDAVEMEHICPGEESPRDSRPEPSPFIGVPAGMPSGVEIHPPLPADPGLVETCRQDLQEVGFDGRRRHCIDVDNLLGEVQKMGRITPPNQSDCEVGARLRRILGHWVQTHLHVLRGGALAIKANALLSEQDFVANKFASQEVRAAEDFEAAEAALALMTKCAWQRSFERARLGAGAEDEDHASFVDLLVQATALLLAHIDQAEDMMLNAGPSAADRRSPSFSVELEGSIHRLLQRTTRLSLAYQANIDALTDMYIDGATPRGAELRELRTHALRRLANLVVEPPHRYPRVPIFFIEAQGNNGQYFASSDHLINAVAQPAVDHAAALYTTHVREGLVRAMQQGFVEQHAQALERDRQGGVKRHYGAEIAAMCGWKGISGEEAIDKLRSGEQTLKNCFFRENINWRSNARPDREVLRGSLGEAALTVLAAAKDLDLATRVHADAEERTRLLSEFCRHTAASLEEDTHALRRLLRESDRVEEEIRRGQQWQNHLQKVGGFLSVVAHAKAGNVPGAIDNLLGLSDSASQEAAQRLRHDLEKARRAHTLAAQIRETARHNNHCLHEVAVSRLGRVTHLEGIQRRMIDLRAARLALCNRELQAERLYGDCLAALAQEPTLPPQLRSTFHGWLGEDTAAYERHFQWAKEATSEAVRAFSFELQASLALAGQATAARTPRDLEAILLQLRSRRYSREVHGQRPERMSIFLSLQEDILGRTAGEQVKDKPTREKSLQAYLKLPDAAVFGAQGHYLGQGIRFAIGPDINATQCGEKIWRVEARLKGDPGVGHVPVGRLLLLKAGIFSSNWCRPEEHRESVLQTASAAHLSPLNLTRARPLPNLFAASSSFTCGHLQPRTDITDVAFYLRDWGAGGTEAMAGQGLFGSYTIVFPPDNTFPLEAIDDVELRIDYLFVDRAHIQ